MRIALAITLLGRLAAAQTDPDEHGHGHRHKHPHASDPHHHHDHAHPHAEGQGHHHPFVVEPPPPIPPPHPAAAPPSPPEVRDFSPRHGPPGSRVTISGVRFAPDAQVVYAGRRLQTKVEGASTLVVQLPKTAVSDVLIVRQKGFPDVRSAASFVVEPAPIVASLSPASASPGAVVVIRGRNFLEGDRVLFGDLAAEVLSATPERLEIVVPPDAADCRPTVARPLSAGTSARLFRVVAPQPVVTGIQPAVAAPGATVRILGKNFLPDDRALLGRTSVPILARGPEFLDVTIPPNARSAEFSVVGQGRQARFEAQFTVLYPPQVTGMQPSWATPGARVTLRGNHFVAGDAVQVGDKAALDLRVGAEEISFTVPDDAQTATVAVVRGEVRAATRAPLEIVAPPVIEGFDPAGGPGGTVVTLRGRHLAKDARVTYGTTALSPVSRRPPTEIDVRIPEDAAPARFGITTRAGQTEGASFEIWAPAGVKSFEPAFGQAGTQVIIHGHDFTQEDKVSLAGQDLPLQSVSAEALTVIVPAGAKPGPFVVRSRGRDLATRQSFRVVAPPPPAVLTFAPINGPSGTEVVIRTGRRFTGADRVTLGGIALAKTLSAGGAELRVTIPAGARTGRFEVVTASGERVLAEQPFQVVEVGSTPAANTPGVY